MTESRPSARETILRKLKQSNGLTARELAAALSISTVGVRKHLDLLQQQGLVTVTLRRQPMGRPSYAYLLTPTAAALFPQGYRQMLVDILQEIAATEGETKIRRLFEGRAERQRIDYERQLAHLPLVERVREFARLRNEDGYMTVLEEDERGFLLRQYNCPVEEVSRRFRENCGCEMEMLRRLLGIRRIERIENLASGEHSCAYRIAKPTAG